MVFEGGVGFFSEDLDLNFWAFFQVRFISGETVQQECICLRCLDDTKKVPKDPFVCPFVKGVSPNPSYSEDGIFRPSILL